MRHPAGLQYEVVEADDSRRPWTTAFDQPHLIHDFRALTGETPQEFVRNQGRLSLNFTDPRRLQALLGGS